MKKFLTVLLCSIPLIACADNNEYFKNNEYIEAVKGDVDFQYNTAMNFLNGLENFPKDNKKALYWFTQAANQNDSGAQNALGIMYLRGFGTPKDMVKSEYYYRLAAEQSHSNAELQLALILLSKNNEKLKLEAISWLRKSADQGNEEAIEKLKRLGN